MIKKAKRLKFKCNNCSQRCILFIENLGDNRGLPGVFLGIQCAKWEEDNYNDLKKPKEPKWKKKSLTKNLAQFLEN